jgi:hypothetical protein
MTAKLSPAARKARTARRTSAIAFGTGVAVSLAANVYASEHTPIGIAVGLWVPVAFLVSMALLENVPVKGKWGWVRFAAILFLALVAGWTSYWHLVEVAVDGGADQITAHLLPLTVDVMMALAGPGMKAKAAAPARRARTSKSKSASNVRPIRKAA